MDIDIIHITQKVKKLEKQKRRLQHFISKNIKRIRKEKVTVEQVTL